MSKKDRIAKELEAPTLQCDGCGILIGQGRIEPRLYSYREHELCSWCISRWKKKDARLSRETTWDEFLESRLPELEVATKTISAGESGRKVGYPEQPVSRSLKYRKLRRYKCRVCGRIFKDWYLPEEKRICPRCLSENKGS